ncbi:MAG: hypothetical protein WC533_04100 [Candidatus Pacearchaeota archaeon]
MSKLSEIKKKKISEHVLSILYDKFPEPLFISQVALEVARDEEFIKLLLENLKNKNLVVKISKNSKGIDYLKRTRWRMSNKAHEIYSKNQSITEL